MACVEGVPGLAEERGATLEIFRTLRLCVNPVDLARNILVLARQYSGCEAVAIRLRKGADFPYAASHGFSSEFLSLENRLCNLEADGCLLRDRKGNPILECMCGKVLSGRIDPSAPYFTENSFFTNSTTELLASTVPDQSQERTRNRCHTTGYESVALIPIRQDHDVYGLLQCNDRRQDRFTREGIALLENLATSAANLFEFAML